MMKVKNMVSARSGRTVTNQFDISRTNEAGVIGEYAFQSYGSLCASLKRTERACTSWPFTEMAFTPGLRQSICGHG